MSSHVSTLVSCSFFSHFFVSPQLVPVPFSCVHAYLLCSLLTCSLFGYLTFGNQQVGNILNHYANSELMGMVSVCVYLAQLFQPQPLFFLFASILSVDSLFALSQFLFAMHSPIVIAPI